MTACGEPHTALTINATALYFAIERMEPATTRMALAMYISPAPRKRVVADVIRSIC